MEDYNASIMQGLGTSLAISVSLLVLEQILASSKCESNSLVQFLLNTMRAMHAQDKPKVQAPPHATTYRRVQDLI